MGLVVVGRPSNVSGLDLLVKLLRPHDNVIVVLGERDQKLDGRWPGLDGCKAIGLGLARRLRRRIVTRMPPDGAKDLRAWLNAQELDVTSDNQMAEAEIRFLKGL